MLTRQPEVSDVDEFLEITRDFADPKDVIREAISNAIDWRATEVRVTIKEDRTRPEEELVIEIEDDGIGLNEERLYAFFDLGKSIPRTKNRERPMEGQIGYKGHGTKTYYNSRRIEVWSDNKNRTVHAIMDSPLQNLMKKVVPTYEYEIQSKTNKKTKTKIKICGYNMNKRKMDFGHLALKDYILWKTKFGSVEKEFGIMENAKKVLWLQGLGKDTPEKIDFGHLFAPENCNLNQLRTTRPGDWTKAFCKRWIFQNRPIIDNPGKSIDMVFYVEGDEAKRGYNPMIRGRGKTLEYGMYKVEDRYGLWVCKDHIPIKRYNEWLGLGKRLETKYHAFVNCQEFRLTANRGDIGNTPPDLLDAIERTVRHIFEVEIQQGDEYQAYEEAEELEKQYQTKEQERKDFERRRKRAARKKVYKLNGVELIEPSVEMGVVGLFNLVYGLRPTLFPFRVIDYDTKRGYDALVSEPTVRDLTMESIYFIEFKYMLGEEFNHSFDHLAAVICWDSNLSEGAEVTDIQGKRRELRITEPGNGIDYRRYMLISSTEHHNIEVFVLKDYLHEKLGIEFRPRKKKT